MKPLKRAAMLRSLEGFSGDARLYAVQPPITYEVFDSDSDTCVSRVTEHVVVSAADTLTGPETYIFPADSDGDILSWLELPGSLRGVLDHEAALGEAGYVIDDGDIVYKTMCGVRGAYGHGDYRGYFPRGESPGRWLPPVAPRLYESGYHVCRDLHEVLWHSGQELYVAEARGRRVPGEHEAAYEQIRLLRRVEEWDAYTLRMFAVDVARLTVDRCVASAVTRDRLHACLDVATGYATGHNDRQDVALAREFATKLACCDSRGPWTVCEALSDLSPYILARITYMTGVYEMALRRASEGKSSMSAALRECRKEACALLERYLHGERGPLIEEGSHAPDRRKHTTRAAARG